jgi:hypothetical protein
MLQEQIIITYASYQFFVKIVHLSLNVIQLIKKSKCASTQTTYTNHDCKNTFPSISRQVLKNGVPFHWTFKNSWAHVGNSRKYTTNV